MEVHIIDTNDYTDCERNSVQSIVRADLGEWKLNTIEKIGIKADVRYDGKCGYHTIIATLICVKRECKDTVRDINIDIWESVSNCTHYQENVMNKGLNRIYIDKLKYTGR